MRDLVERAAALAWSAVPFEPATAERRFRIGAPDAAISSLLPGLPEQLGRYAPGIDPGLIALLPAAGTTAPEEAFPVGCPPSRGGPAP